MDYTSEVAVGIARTPREALQNGLRKLSSPPILTSSTSRVVIKPSIYDPLLPGNTSLDLIRSIVRVFSFADRILIVESDNPLRTADSAFSKTGYHQLKELGARLVNLSSEPLEMTRAPGFYSETYNLPKVILGDQFFINLATLKTDPHVRIGAGLKNLFGLIPVRDKTAFHDHLENILLDLLYVIRPNLTILDLTDVIVGSRESGKTLHIGGVLIGYDPVAVDAMGASLLGFDPLNIPLIRRAHELGMGEALPDRIRLVGTEHQKGLLQQAMGEIRNAMASF